MIKLDMRSLYASADSGMLFPLEFAWIELACHDASCRPPTSGGTGGTNTKRSGHHTVSSSEHLDLLFPGRRAGGVNNKVVNADGTFSVEGLDAHGAPTQFLPATEKKLADIWKSIGPTDDQYVGNFKAAGKLAMGIDLKTGAINAEMAAHGTFESKWYSVAHQDCVDVASKTGIPLEAVVAATTTLSAGRLWSGVRNGNIETARNLADIVTHPIEIELSQHHIDMMNWRGAKAEKGVGRIGLVDHGLKPGKFNSNDLDAATLTEVLYAVNTLRGHDSLKSWMVATTKDGKPGAKQSSAQKKVDPPYPFFTSKGTQQVKQAIAILRQEVTPRQAISGPKYSSFYSNIRNPDADYSSTNDTWHYRIMAGNLNLTHTARKETRTASIVEHSIKEFAPDGKVHATTQDIFQRGVESAKDGLAPGDGMFRDTTRITRRALNELAAEHPAQFGKMKLHEFQALIWVHYGGGLASDDARTEKWDNARAQMKEAGL